LATGATLFTDALDPIITTGKGAGGSDRRQVIIEGGSNITIDGLTIDGPNPNPLYLAAASSAGIAVRGAGVILSNLTINEVPGLRDDHRLGSGGGSAPRPPVTSGLAASTLPGRRVLPPGTR
jgi:hypothetical protein